MSAAAVAAESHSGRTKRKGSVYDPALKHRNAPQEIESAGQPVVLLRSEQLRVNRAVLALAGIGLGSASCPEARLASPRPAAGLFNGASTGGSASVRACQAHDCARRDDEPRNALTLE